MNALDELLRVLCKIGEAPLAVKCAVIGTSYKFPVQDELDVILTNPTDRFDKKPVFERVAILKENWKTEDWAKFTEDLQFEYDNSYGAQHLFGTVWFNDDSWLERGEYDGSEWWEHKSLPVIPEELKS